MKKLFGFVLGFCTLVFSAVAATNSAPRHPCLMLTPDEVMTIRAGRGHAPLFDAAYDAARQQIDRALTNTPDVPVPLDSAGVTHLRHAQNGNELQLAGFLYQITGDQRYAGFVKDLLNRYAELYPTLGNIPPPRAPRRAGCSGSRSTSASGWCASARPTTAFTIR